MNEKPTTILVVDDESLNLLLINEYLKESGYRLITAMDGAEAW